MAMKNLRNRSQSSQVPSQQVDYGFTSSLMRGEAFSKMDIPVCDLVDRQNFLQGDDTDIIEPDEAEGHQGYEQPMHMAFESEPHKEYNMDCYAFASQQMNMSRSISDTGVYYQTPLDFDFL
jgi:hypothetical protein